MLQKTFAAVGLAAAALAATAAPAATAPAGCGGTGWGAIVNVGDQLKVGLASSDLTSPTAAVMGGYTAYGWVLTAGSWYTVSACGHSGPQLGEQPGYTSGSLVELATGYGDSTAWNVVSAGSGASYIKDYLGQNCLTDNGSGRQLTFTTCAPGSPAQEWRLP
ncbi:hypothetical protein GCM10009665_69040 [Kitasatospora nipponensis]|uniref:Ricin-type beta-trefoil lectin protein n=1 Tax=Kitasatospora nipponensis TaxID=258049 RepID=A0ABP4HQA5_9ACTN